ncbi:MAG: hypothetical protein DWH91_15685 [Planctomycetota bacterium]|nr:MAG: hypothetical protein DWH91_15685 [Planctomycetota bacterium]
MGPVWWSSNWWGDGECDITVDCDWIKDHCAPVANLIAGCGIFISHTGDDYEIEVAHDELVGKGLVLGSNCSLDVALGCGLQTHPKFHRTAVSYMLNNRFYIGEIKRGRNFYQGRHRPLIDRSTFQTCQDVLSGKNRRAKPQVNMPLSGGLFTCQHCGAFITGERIKRKLKGGGVRVHDYYRCANNYQDENHPSVRWRSDDLDEVSRPISTRSDAGSTETTSSSSRSMRICRSSSVRSSKSSGSLRSICSWR